VAALRGQGNKKTDEPYHRQPVRRHFLPEGFSLIIFRGSKTTWITPRLPATRWQGGRSRLWQSPCIQPITSPQGPGLTFPDEVRDQVHFLSLSGEWEITLSGDVVFDSKTTHTLNNWGGGGARFEGGAVSVKPLPSETLRKKKSLALASTALE